MNRTISTCCAVMLTFAFAHTLHGQDLAKAVNLGEANTKADEDDPFYVFSDGRHILLYTSNTAGTFDVMASQLVDKKWTSGQPVDSVNTDKADERSPFLFAGRNIFYTSNEIPDEKFKDLQNFDMFQKTGMLAAFRLVGMGVNEKEDETDLWITSTGREFYFSRKLKEGMKIFVANGPKPGPIGGVKDAGLPVGFHHPTITKSGTTMYLQGPEKDGRSQLYRSKRTRLGGKWSKPEPIVNLLHKESKKGDMSPCVTPSGKNLFFASDRPEGQGGLDIWMVAVDELKFGE